MQRQYVHVETRTLAYFDSAPGDRALRVALFVHAFPLGAAMWEPQFKSVPAGWRFLAIDLRGFGGSTIYEGAERAPRIDDYATDVVDLLREIGLSKVVLVGLSMGGYVTLAVLRRAPDVVMAVVLADTRAGADTPEGRGNRRNMLALLDREGPQGVARDMMAKLLGRTSSVERPELESVVRRLIKQQPPEAIRGAIERMMERPDSGDVLCGVTVPTLIIVGDEDELTPVEEARKMHALAPNAELVIVPRTGHLANLEQPHVFNSTIADFLSRL